MAATNESKAYEALKGISGGDALGNLLPRIEQFVFYLGLAVCIIFIILAGYQFFFGEESSKKNAEDAQRSLTYAVVGLVILLLLNLIFRILSGILGFNFDPSSITK
jgi:hypothetical protein